MKSGDNASASVTGLTIKNVDVKGYTEGAIRLRYNTNKVLIENVNGDGEARTGEQYVFGVSFADTAHDVVLRKVTMANNYGHGGADFYWNGDGFTTERGNYNFYFEDTVASGSTDGGYDLKSSETSLLRARAEGNSRNFRIWGDSTIADCVSLNPRKRGGSGKQNHFWVASGAKARVTGCQIEDRDSATTVFEVGQKGEIIVRDSLVATNPGARLSLIDAGGSLDIVTTK
jgi:hypothetical protein